MSDDVLVLLPLPRDPVFVEAVEDALSGGAEAQDLPGAQPQRRVGADPRDFASLYIRHRSSFALHARRFLNDPRDVDEVLQEAFLRLFLAMPELESELQALSYCRRTVTNLCIDRYRADRRRPRLVDLDEMRFDPSDESSYDDPVLRAEDAAIVREALAQLSPMYRAALVKREIEEKPLPQIAAELGVPEESVKHLLHRARRALRRLLVGTTADPNADLTNIEMLRLANERLARATLRGSNVLIVLFVIAVTVVGGFRVTSHDQSEGRGDFLPPAVDQGVAGAAGNPAHAPTMVEHPSRPQPHPAAPRHDGEAPAKVTPAVSATPAQPAPTVPASRPAPHESWGHEPVGGHAPSAPAADDPGTVTPSPVDDSWYGDFTGAPLFSVEGAVTETAPPAVTTLAADAEPSTSASRFVAATSAGILQLDQSFPAAGPVSIRASLVADGATIALPVGQILIEPHRGRHGAIDLTVFITIDSVSDGPPHRRPAERRAVPALSGVCRAHTGPQQGANEHVAAACGHAGADWVLPAPPCLSVGSCRLKVGRPGAPPCVRME